MTVFWIANSAQTASDAFEAYAAMRRAEAREPALPNNDYWRGCVSAAWRRFLTAFEAMQ